VISLHIFLLLVAVTANVTANLPFKKAVSVHAEAARSVTEILLEPWIWLGCVASAILLASYLVAISKLHIDVVYAIVTTGALVVLSIIAPTVFGTSYSAVKIGGILLSLSGIALLLYSQAQG